IHPTANEGFHLIVSPSHGKTLAIDYFEYSDGSEFPRSDFVTPWKSRSSRQPAPDLPLVVAQPSEKGPMDKGRREKRSPKKFVVLLSNGAKPVVASCASTENVSDNGARVRTVSPWKQDTRVLVKSSLGELLARARVVYCRTLPDGTFAVGLEFLARTGAWVTG